MNSVKKFLKDKEKRELVYKIISIAVVLLFFIYFLTHKELYTLVTKGVTHYYKKRLAGVSFVFLVLAGYFLVKNKLSPKINKIIAVAFTAISPVYAFLLMEVVSDSLLGEMSWFFIALNLLILYMLLLVLLAVTNSLKIAPTLLVIFAAIFSIANYFVFEFRGSPFMASDIASIGTAADVSSGYTYQLNFRSFVGLLAAIGFVVIISKVKNTKLFGWKVRIGYCVATLILSVVLVNSVVLSNQLEEWNVKIRMFKPMDSYRAYGSALTFTRSIRYAIVDKPQDYSVNKVKEIIDKYKHTDDMASLSDKTVATNVEKPNIIAIVDEAFSDLKVLGDFKTNKDYIPFINSLSENTIKGYSYASVIGGMTANTEFEFLTNNSMAFLPSQAVAFQLYVNKPMFSLTRSLEAMGYTGNYALHPHSKNNYNRPKVYDNLGFNYFFTNQDFTPEEKSTGKVRRYLSDKFSFNKIIQEYEKARGEGDQPFYMYDLTVQNHSPYDQPYDNLVEDIQLDDKHFDNDANRYLNLIKYTDTALEELVNYFKAVNEPTMIIFFGDHQPRVSNSFLNSITGGKFKSWGNDKMMERYKVPFVIWANYDIPEKTVEKTSMNYLQTILLQTAGCKLTDYQKFLLDFMKDVPVINANGYYGADNKFYLIEDATSPYYERVNEYRILQYNNVIDTKNRVNSFFGLEK